MPRARRAYANRTDLNMPQTTVPGQTYGKQTAQRNDERLVPMGRQPNAAPSAPQPSAAPSRAPQPLPRPGTLPYIAPTQRPEEPVTSGLPFGPGPGPEALQPPTVPLSQQLSQAALHSGSDAVAQLAMALHSIGH